MNSPVRIIIIAPLLALSLAAQAKSLTISYFERPLYYYTEQNKAAGFLVEKQRKILKDTGIKVIFSKLPSKRILKRSKILKILIAPSVGLKNQRERNLQNSHYLFIRTKRWSL